MIRGREIALDFDDKYVGATLAVPDGAQGLVIFAHGSGSSRHSPRNQFVAQTLNGRGVATLLLDLLTDEEEEFDRRTVALRFDIALLARRVDMATDWTRKNRDLRGLRVGYFGASSGAGAALFAASKRDDVHAIVSRGGRPDLAGDALASVTAPTLLIIGERDALVIDLNRRAAAQMQAPCTIEIVPNATHLFEEAGALERVADLAQDWFVRYLPAPAPRQA